ncbi:nucleotidyltransferase family protein [Roseobacter sp.]|uniref:nucleotidyltransferase family protein n=1 Tax=Roseobacter sp. TaxID=1907202 RepID=UPI0029665670|nr:nucleotidyltransferase family protein [Roseobacter sp.]MDW3180803.1 nucleotidyltransferase family protein [Roseobacter sp.]
MELTPEQAFMLASARARAVGADWPEVPEALDHMALLLLAQRHRMATFVATSLLSQDIPRPVRERRIDKFFVDARMLGAVRNAKKRAVALALQAAFLDAGIPSILRKGCHLDTALYGGTGLREFNDIDVFIPPDARRAALRVAQAQGFAAGWFDAVTGRFQPTSRKEKIYYDMTPDHLPPMQLMRAEDPVLPAIKLDLCFDLAWAQHPQRDQFEPILLDALAVVEGQSEPVGQTDLAFHLLDVSMHIYREARHQQTLGVNDLAGVRLPKFLDVSVLCHALTGAQRARFRTWCKRSPAIAAAASWVLHHTDTVMGSSHLNSLGLRADPFHLQQWVTQTAAIRTWRGTMIDRLFAADPKSLFAPDLSAHASGQ